jgi:hypothetical protein
MAAIAGWLWPREGPFGSTDASTGLPEEVGWTILLALLLFWAIRRLTKRKAEGEQPAVVEENRRKARLLYEEAFGAGDFSIIDEVVAERFFDPSADATVRRDSSVPSQVFAAPSPTCASRSRSRARRATR